MEINTLTYILDVFYLIVCLILFCSFLWTGIRLKKLEKQFKRLIANIKGEEK